MAKKKRKTPLKTSRGTSSKVRATNKISFPKFGYLIGLGVFLAIYAIIRTNFLDVPFERDEGDYCLAGQLVLEGGTPYVDFYEQKPPGLFYTYAFLELIFGKNNQMLHVAFILINLLTSWFLYKACDKIFDSRISGYAAAVAFLVLSMNPFVSGFTIQSEHLIAFFLSASLMALSIALRKDHWKWYLFAGMLVSWSMTIKQNGLFFTVAFGILLLLMASQLKWPRVLALRNIGAYIAGTFAPVLLLILIIAVQGAFDDMVFWVYNYPKEAYVSNIPFDRGMTYLKYWFEKISETYMVYWLGAGLGLIGLWITKLSWQKKAGLTVFALFLFLSIVPGYRFYGHYWLHLLPGVAFLFGSVFYVLEEKLSKYALVPFALFALVTIIGLSSVIGHQDYYFKPNLDRVVRSVYGTNPFPETKKLSDYIKRNSTEGDQIVVVGSEPQVHFYTKLSSPSRHTFLAFLVSNHPKENEWHEELKSDIENAEPRYMLMVWHPMSWAFREGADDSIVNWLNNYGKIYYKPVAYADLVSPSTKYVWGDEAKNYQPTSDKYLVLLERKSAPKFPGTQN